MKGSPIIRSIFILLLLVASGFGFMHVTSDAPRETVSVAVDNAEDPKGNTLSARYFLTLSAEAGEVVLDAGNGPVYPEKLPGREYQGTIEIDMDGGLIDLRVRWQGESQEHYFAKLVLEAEGRETITHVFDSRGDIEDFIELPF